LHKAFRAITERRRGLSFVTWKPCNKRLKAYQITLIIPQPFTQTRRLHFSERAARSTYGDFRMIDENKQTEQPQRADIPTEQDRVHDVKAFFGGVVEGDLYIALVVSKKPYESYLFRVLSQMLDDFQALTNHEINIKGERRD
jgi:hypothetical protein